VFCFKQVSGIPRLNYFYNIILVIARDDLHDRDRILVLVHAYKPLFWCTQIIVSLTTGLVAYV